MTDAALEHAIATGMLVAHHAAARPDHPALVTEFGNRTFGELNAGANRLLRTLRAHGIGNGDAIAVLTRNRPEFVEALAAADRGGLRLTPINFHLGADEIGYIVNDCEAKAFIADAGLGDAPARALAQAPGVRLALACGGPLDGFADYATTTAPADPADIPDPSLGGRMLYTSGTTGRPKGVFRRQREPFRPQWAGTLANYDPATSVALCTGPAYHAAPLLIDITNPLNSGATVVMMNRWDAEKTLQLVEQHRVSHSHMVATMFHRLLALPEAVRTRYDLSSLRIVVHGAAPCPVHVKHAMIEWFGPIIWEYYAATEGGGGFMVGSHDWLKRPGTVGRCPPEMDNRILDDDGNECPPGVVGTIYMPAPAQGRFEYFKDPDKTGRSYRGEHFTLGDMGYFDADRWLFLTGRTAELIISGGVNIYPQEVDSELLKHPAVADVCTVGIPHDEWGEEVRSVVQVKPGVTADAALAAALVAFARERLAHFKCPRAIDFVAELPRSAAGKIQRRVVREPYWAGRDRQI